MPLEYLSDGHRMGIVSTGENSLPLFDGGSTWDRLPACHSFPNAKRVLGTVIQRMSGQETVKYENGEMTGRDAYPTGASNHKLNA